jgi:small-conductance mechanosensitive channel
MLLNSKKAVRRVILPIVPVILLCAISAAALLAQTQGPDQQTQNNVLSHLNAVIGWYRDLTTRPPAGALPSDVIFQENVRQQAIQVVQLAFQSARAESVLLGNTNGTNGASGSPDNTSQTQATVSQRIDDNQARIDQIDKEIPAASAGKRRELIAQKNALAGQVNLDKAMLDALQKMAAFREGMTGGKGFEGSIDELARSVPEIQTDANAQKPAEPAKAPTNAPGPAESSGLIGQLASLYAQMENMRAIDRLLSENARIAQVASNLREPLRTQIRATLAQGQQLSNQAQSGAPVKPGTQAPDYEALTRQFNEQAAALLPLTEELAVLDQSRANLTQWHNSISNESKHGLLLLLTRVIFIAFALGVVLALSELWRRVTFRYVHDARRRRQFLVLRRFVVGFLIGLVVVLGFVSEFSSLATYAGLVTAGIAVGLQTVLLSVAAYFLVLGRYGIRVGDRISVAGVTGDVVDVGLVRFYLMELAGFGIDLHPTGRIAVFSNSVLFQATTPLFKQIPGTEYAWHAVAVTLAPNGDHKLAQTKLLGAVESVYADYRKDMESQQGVIGDRMEIVLKAPAPEALLQLETEGIELLVRYPVDIHRSAEIDDRMARSVVDAIDKDEKLRAAISGTPSIRAVVKG